MAPEPPRDILAIFEAALDREGADRTAFIDSACAGDPALRTELEDLLQWHGSAENGTCTLFPVSVTAQAISALVRASSLACGHFGPFSVESKLGEGSTAIVYRAIDTRSRRVVALKVGSARTLLDPASRRRFEQAAAAVVELRHPHIARTLDSGVEQDVPWLAMEFVEGRTLADLIKNETPGLATSLKFGRQIAEALAAAHEQRIVHRDLKPANIIVSHDGNAKVLDFGLCHAAPGRESIAGTQSGFLLGTPGYMAPELARGITPAPASDIFSLGAVLYEMFSGLPAFRGENTVATLSCVLHEMPPPMAGVPSAIQALVERCLKKDPSQRPASAAEVATALLHLERGVAQGRVRVRPGWDGLRSRVRRLPRRTLIGFAVASFALCAATAGAYRFRSATHVPAPRQITFDQSVLNIQPAVSADRKWIAFASDRSGDGNLDMWIVSTAGPASRQPRRLTRQEINARQPEFSPDGRTLVFRSDRDGGGIFQVRLDSAEPPAPAELIAPDGVNPRFSPDGKHLAYWVGLDSSADVLAPGASKAFILDRVGSKPRQVCPEFGSAAYPVWSPDGESILFAGRRRFPAMYQDHFVWMTRSGECSPIGVAKPWDFPNSKISSVIFPQRWLPGNRLLFRTEEGVVRGMVELHVTAAADGRSMQPAQLIYPVDMPRLAGEFGVAYAQVRDEGELGSLPVGESSGGDGVPVQTVRCGGEFCIPVLSPDGAVLFYSRYRADGWEFVRAGSIGADEKVVAPSGTYSPWPFVIGSTHDLVFARQTDDERVDVHRVSSKTGNHDDTVICRNCEELWDASPTGRFLLGMSGKERRTIQLIDSVHHRLSELLWHPQWNLYRASFSPDESSILFTAKTAADRSVLLVAPFSGTNCGPPESWVAVSDDTTYNGPGHWSPDGDRIYFTSQSDGHRCFYMRGWDRRHHSPTGPITAVRHFHAEGESPGLVPQSLFGFSVASDRIVFEMRRRVGNIWMMN